VPVVVDVGDCPAERLADALASVRECLDVGEVVRVLGDALEVSRPSEITQERQSVKTSSETKPQTISAWMHR
jgi:hypothetical protein